MNKTIEQDLEHICTSPLIPWEKFQNTTVLITGANGMLPSYIVFSLLYLNRIKNYNIHVIALVRNKEKATKKFKDFLHDRNLSLLIQDVTSPIKVDCTIDYIVHAASQASPKYYGTDPVGTINANVEGCTQVLTLARNKATKSLLYFSSGEVYGVQQGDAGRQLTESEYGTIDPLSVRSCYGQSKRMGETLCVCWNSQYNTHAKIVRPFHCYGPGMLLDDGRVFADFVGNILHNENIVLRSTGEARRAFCYVTDATLAFFKVLLCGTDGEAYNVGNPDGEISICELAQLLASLYPEKGLKVEKHVLENDMRTVKMKSPLSASIPSIDKLKNLGFAPEISVEEGFRRTISSFENEEKHKC